MESQVNKYLEKIAVYLHKMENMEGLTKWVTGESKIPPELPDLIYTGISTYRRKKQKKKQK